MLCKVVNAFIGKAEKKTFYFGDVVEFDEARAKELIDKKFIVGPVQKTPPDTPTAETAEADTPNVETAEQASCSVDNGKGGKRK
jgi:hypothetical protein